MDLHQLAKQHLETALREGKIILEDGSEIPLKGSEILAISRYVIKESLFDTISIEKESVFPNEMLELGPSVSVED